MNETFANYTFTFGLAALVVDGFIWGLLGLYLEKVLPKQYGVRYPAWFLCTPQYWRDTCGCCKKPKKN
jgi:ATP-binding cassette subfamily A (ABC1) protein 1